LVKNIFLFFLTGQFKIKTKSDLYSNNFDFKNISNNTDNDNQKYYKSDII
jgi:hypothetical protein